MLLAHVFAPRPVNTRNEGILMRFPCLNVRSVHTSVLAPLFECLTQKRGAIVRPNARRQAMVTPD